MVPINYLQEWIAVSISWNIRKHMCFPCINICYIQHRCLMNNKNFATRHSNSTMIYIMMENDTCVIYNNAAFVNTMRSGPNGRHFTDDIFKCIFLNESVWIPIKISKKFVPEGPISNIQSLSEPMLVSLTTHICVTRPQWANGATELTQCGPMTHIWRNISGPTMAQLLVSCLRAPCHHLDQC